MKQLRSRLGIGIFVVVFCMAFIGQVSLYAASRSSDKLTKNLAAETVLAKLQATSAPELETPAWYKKQVEDEQRKQQTANAQAPTNNNAKITVTYSVSSNGATRGNVQEFAQLANATLNDPRGWSQLDAKFVQVSSGGMFRLVLSQAALLPSYSASGCLVDWSCTVGNMVIINDDRWMGATDSWNQAGGSLRDYRHMVVNHEVGHWLGHGHSSCGGAGQPAPLMQQQSMDLQGCRFNPWPLPSELWSSRI